MIGNPGNCVRAELRVTSGSVVTYNDPNDLRIGTDALLYLCGGTVNGTSKLINFASGGSISGCGTMTLDIDINNGGTFGDCSAACDILILSGLITDDDNDAGGAGVDLAEADFTIKGGNIQLGAANRIDDALDIVMDGGNFNTGGFSETVDNLTLSQNSNINLGAGAHSLQANDLTLGGNTLTVNGWTGTGGASGTAGRLIFTAIPTGMAVGTGNTGVTWGGFGTDTTLLDLGGGLYEIVPTGVAVPEPSTYICSGAILAYCCFELRRRQRRRKSH
jgi:hypothetical protein